MKAGRLYGVFVAACLSMFVSASPVMAGLCVEGEPSSYTSAEFEGECPADIQSWMDRSNGCLEYITQKKNEKNPDRQVEIEDAMIDLQCEYTGCDYHDLLTKYEGDEAFSAVVKGYAVAAFGDGKVPSCDIENNDASEESKTLHEN